MSPRIEVPSLKKMCQDYVVVLLTHAVCDDEKLDCEALLGYIDDGTFEVLQDLLNSILSLSYLDASIRFNCLQLLLREDVRRLETDIFPYTYYENILRIIEERGIGLEYLNFKGMWIKESTDLLCRIIRKLKKLKTLIIPHVASDEVLKAITFSDKLVYLDISGECTFTREYLQNFKSNTLRVLSLGYYGKRSICHDEKDSSETVAKLIRNLPNLVALLTYSFTGNALQKIFESEPSFKSKLEYVHDTATTEEACEAIIKTCPELKSIYLDAPLKGVLDILATVKSLHTLKLNKPYCEQLMQYLVKAGHQIQVLKLLNIKDNIVDMDLICKYAPNLQTLECFKLNITCSKSDQYFMSLESVDFSYCNTSNGILRFLLSNCPKLRRLVVGDRVKLTDGDMFRICAEGVSAELQELWFASARYLTATSVELLMKCCPNLKCLGQINAWDINTNDLNFLFAVIASTNTNLALISRDASSWR